MTVAGQTLMGVHLSGVDFSGQNLSHADLSHSQFINCNFDDARMIDAKCEASVFTGSTFRRTVLSGANFKDAYLGATVFEPSDAYGITLTMHCKTFTNMRVSRMYWLAFMILASMMIPERRLSGDEDLKAKLIEMIGPVRYTKLRELFSRRDF